MSCYLPGWAGYDFNLLVSVKTLIFIHTNVPPVTFNHTKTFIKRIDLI